MSREPERNDFSPWVGVVNQGPLVSTTNVFRLEHMLAARPVLYGPKQTWFGVDAAGIVRWVWRIGDQGGLPRVPLALEALAAFDEARA